MKKKLMTLAALVAAMTTFTACGTTGSESNSSTTTPTTDSATDTTTTPSVSDTETTTDSESTETTTPEVSKYSVTLTVSDTFEVVTAPVAEAEEGDTVSFQLRAKEGYTLSSVTVADVEVTDNGEGNYSFVMPARAVEIVVETAQLTYSISVTEADTFTYTLKAGDADYTDPVAGGTNVSFTLALVNPTDFKLTDIKVIAGETAVETTLDLANFKVDFTMPFSDVTITPIVKSTKTTVTIVNNIALTSKDTLAFYVAKSKNGAYGKPDEQYKDGDEIPSGSTVYLARSIDAGYDYPGIKLIVTDDEGLPVGNVTGIYELPKGSYNHPTFTMPNSAITITAEYL